MASRQGHAHFYITPNKKCAPIFRWQMKNSENKCVGYTSKYHMKSHRATYVIYVLREFHEYTI